MEKTISKGDHFWPIFWFIVGVCGAGFALTIFLIIYLPKEQSIRIADNALMFWLSTGVAGGIGYLIGNSAKVSIPNVDPKANISSITETKTVISSPVDEVKK